MSVVLFLAALFCGYFAGRVSVKNNALDLSNKELTIQEELTVAKNLNNSLYVDLQQAKETIRKLKQK
jgi:hypothetical protein